MNSTAEPEPAVLIVAGRYTTINNLYIIPSICGFGIITNLICCIIFLLPKFRLKIYRLLFWKSFFHLAGLMIQVFSPIVLVDPIGYSYATGVYRWLIKTWIYNAFSMAALLCNLAVSFDRLIMISKKCDCFCSKIPELVLVAAFFLFSLACFFFPFFAYVVVPADPEYYPAGYYWLSYTDWGYTLAFVEVRVAMFGLRDIILWFLFVVVNGFLLYEARKVFRRKAKLTTTTARPSVPGTSNQARKQSETASEPSGKVKTKNQSAQAESRMTYMTVIMSGVLAFGQMPYFINIILYAVWYYSLTDYRIGISVVLNQLAFDTLYSSFAVSIFIYYFFDKNFKSVIDELFKRIIHRS